jgi:O-antigen/teichoic acid export membrane protein
VVFVIFGPGWEKTGSLITVLSFVGIFKALSNPGGAIILALGRADIGFWWNLFWVMIVATTLFVMLSLVPRVETAAYTLLTLSLTVGMLWHFIIAKISKIRYWPIARHFCLLILISFAIGWIGHTIVNLLSIKTSFFRVVVGGGIFWLIYSAFVLFSQKVMLKHSLRR